MNCTLFKFGTKSQFVSLNINSRLSRESLELSEKLIGQLDDAHLSDQEKSEVDLEYVKTITPTYEFDSESIAGLNIPARKLGPSYETGNDYGRQRDQGELLASLKQITCPAVAMNGEYDVIPYKEVLEALKSGLAELKTYIFAECGHFPWLEKCSNDFIHKLNRELA